MQTPNVRVPRKGGHNFAQIPQARIPRSAFDRSRGNKLTFDAGLLVPIYVDDVLPGDTVNLSMNGMVRIFSPLKAPIMDNLYFETWFFFVPNRLVWDNWQKFCGEQEDPGDSIDYTIPKVGGSSTVGLNSMWDYLGIPLGLDFSQVDVSILPARGYVKIYNEWFRDQNLVDSYYVVTTDGPDSGYGAWTSPLKRAKRHDYFTSCLPWPQKGTAAQAQFDVLGIGKSDQIYTVGPINVYETGGAATTSFASAVDMDASNNNMYIEEDANNTGFPGIFANVTINELRNAYMIQRLNERDARGGTRYTEILRSHFGVISPDARLQRPEYLGGGRSMVNISPVAQTGETGTTPQGTLAAVGTSATGGHGFAKSFVEHGYIIGICSVRADLTYQQGLPRHYSRATRYDFYWPELAGLGEQAVLNKEIWVSNSAATDDAVFGYIPRWDEYRFGQSTLHGKFRSDTVGSLDLWHLAQDFATLPALNQTFIEEDIPMSRIQAVTTEPDFIADLWFTEKWARPLPTFGVPGMSENF